MPAPHSAGSRKRADVGGDGALAAAVVASGHAGPPPSGRRSHDVHQAQPAAARMKRGRDQLIRALLECGVPWQQIAELVPKP